MESEESEDRTLFMFNDGFIPLPDLENWYEQGYVTPDDRIRIFEKNKKSYAIRISALILIYGAEFPFRMIPRGVLNEEEDSRRSMMIPGPSSSSINSTVIPKRVGGAFGASRRPSTPPSERILEERKEAFFYVDYPLYNADYESEEDWITGQQVIDEMAKLQTILGQKKWTITHNNFFYFINRRKRGDREEVAMCRLCNYTPYSPGLFFKHLFHHFHIQRLSENRISRKSFDFWRHKFEEVNGNGKSEERYSGKIEKSERVSTSSEVRNSGNLQKYPRIPLLVPPLGDDFDRCTQKEFINFFKSLAKALSIPAAKSIAHLRNVNWKCDYCSLNRIEVKFSTELEAFNHLMTQKHKEKMRFSAPTEELLFWGDWAIEINNEVDKMQSPTIQKTSENRNSESPKPTSMFQKFERSSESPGKSSAGQRLPPTALNLANTPRVPMMDQILRNENSVTKHKFNEILDQCADMFQKDRKRLSGAKLEPVHWNCTYCSTTERTMRPSNMQDVLLHILKQAHREKMQFKASLSDLMHWKTWAENYGISQKVLEQRSKTVETTKVDTVDKTDPKNTMVFDYRTTGIPAKQPARGIEKNEPFKKGFNNPRIPILDVPSPENQRQLLKQSIFKEKYASICEQLKTRKSGPETDKTVTCICYHCPGDTRISTVFGIIQHVFNGKHDHNIRFTATLSDFQYFENIIQKMPLSSEAVAVKRTPVSIVNPIPKVVEEQSPLAVQIPSVSPPKPSIAPPVPTIPQARVSPVAPVVNTVPVAVKSVEPPTRQPCQLPLFTRRQIVSGWEPGPRNVQIAQVRNISNHGLIRTAFFGNKEYCGLCNVDMSFWTLLEVVRHAFSVEHVQHIAEVATWHDYQWWIDKMIESYHFYTSDPTASVHRVTHLGFLNIKAKNNKDIFVEFTHEQMEIIANVDEVKLNSNPQLLNFYGGCVYCKKWLLTGREVLEHWTNDGHINNIRLQHPISQLSMYYFCNYLSLCQIERRNCIIM